MPEGPEVKILTRQIRKLLEKNYTFDNIKIVDGPYKNNKGVLYKNFRDNVNEFIGLKVKNVNSNGKFMYITFANQKFLKYIGIGYGLHGSFRSEKPDNSLRMIFTFSNKSGKKVKLYFIDQTNMGRLTCFDSKKELLAKLKTLGPDITGLKFTESAFKDSLKKYPRKALYTALTDQKIVSGIGNYLRSDICYVAKVSLFSQIKDLSSRDLKKIYKAIKKIVSEVLLKNGSKNYGTLNGKKGKYNFYVYEHRGKKTEKGEKVQTKKVGSQTVFFVER